jgi:serine/threonine protein kinase
MNDAQNAAKACGQCGVFLTPNAPEGLCPRCLLALNLAAQTKFAEEADADPDLLAKGGQPPSTDEIAKHFPHLEILDCLGRGGMGVVYKARHSRLNRLVALKILAPEKERDQRFAARFTHEAQALARLNHPSIVGVYDFGETDGFYYLLMEFVDGVSLRHLLHSKTLTPEQALAVVPEICEALQYAHERAVVHRDIKPENLLVDKAGKVKIADFGIAKIVRHETGRSALTQDQQVMGTPHYMAPEQVEHPDRVDHRADIYSLGVVFYEMLTGELPLGKFQLPSRKAKLDARLDDVVLKALEKEPELRYQQAVQVKTDLETIASTVASLPADSETRAISDSESAVIPEPKATPTRAKRNGILAGLGAAILLLGLVAWATDVWKWQPGLRPKPSAWKTAPLKEGIPPRDPSAGSNLVDLTKYYNAALSDNWHDPLDTQNHLGELPTGVQILAGTQFDVRGLIQLMPVSQKYPPRVDGIPVRQTCQRLHFLHAAIFSAFMANGQEIGRYVVHYVNGEQRHIPIVSGRDVVDWYEQSEGSCVVAWTGENPKIRRSGGKVRLFKSSWLNPLPEVEILTIDFIATQPGDPAPFLVAITAE